MSTKAEQCEWRGRGAGGRAAGGERGALPGLPPPWWASRQQPGGEVFFFIIRGVPLFWLFPSHHVGEARPGLCPPAAAGPGGNRCGAAGGRAARSRARCRARCPPSCCRLLGSPEASWRSCKPVLSCSKEEDACVLSFRACRLFTVMDGGAVQVLRGCWFVAVGMCCWPRN